VAVQTGIPTLTLYVLAIQAQQRQVEAENEALRAAWRAACDAISHRRTASAEAKTAAEHDLATARTQQAAERAQAAIAAAVVEAAEAQAQQVVELINKQLPRHCGNMLLACSMLVQVSC